MRALRMACRFARGGTGRLALTVLAIACGVALIGAVRLANEAVLRAFVEVVDTMAGRASLAIVAGEGGLLPERVAREAAAVAGVEAAVPSVRATAFVTGTAEESLTIYGVDVTSDVLEHVYGARLEMADPVLFIARPDSIAVARSFAAAHGMALGDSVDLITPVGRRRFILRGLLDAEGVVRAYGGNVGVMDLHVAEEVFTRRGLVNAVDIVVAPGSDLRQVGEAITRRLPPGLRVEAPAQRQADVRKVTAALRVALQALGFCGLVAAFLISFNRLSTGFEERAWQLGVLRAVGMTTGAVWRLLLGESILVGAAGAALGVPLGIALGRGLVPVIATASAVADRLVVPPAAIAADPGGLLLAGALGLVTAVLAAALPAWRAAHVAAVKTMMSRGCEAPGAGARIVWAGRALALLATGGGLASLTRYPSAGTGLAATVLVAAGTALAARPTIALADVVLRTVVQRMVGPVGRFAAAGLLRHPRRAALTVATLGVGLGCVVWFWTMAQSFRGSLVDVLTAGVRADLIVISVHVTNGYVEAPLSDELARRVAAVPGVATVAASRVVDWPHEGRRIAIEALDARYFTDPSFGRWPLGREQIGDVWERVAQGDAVVVSANFLSNFETRVGDRIVLTTPRGPLSLLIAGTTSAFESPAGTVQMSRELFASYWDDGQVNRIGLRAAPAADVEQIRKTIARDLGTAYDLQILSARELIGYYADQVGRAFAPLGVLAAAVLVVTLFGVADTLLAAVIGRTRELGTARAIGLPRRSVVRLEIMEALALAAMGIVLALASGIGLAALWVHDTLPHLLGWVLALYLPYRELPLLAALTFAFAGAAALLPAARAARLEPVCALRQE